MIDTTMSHYRVTGKIGAGGMGEVYRAQDTKLNREVALKVLPEEFSRDAERMARFRREAQLLASLNHPNIATIYGLEEQDGKFALAMELAGGEGLDERVRRGPLPLDEALAIALQIIEALEAAHEKGIIHRDLKPANIKVSAEGVVKVLDFGLAKALEGEASDADLAKSPTISMAATRAGIILGTAAYMSPEQAKGKRVDRRADVWSFGAVLYEMLSGQQAFAGETTTDVLAAVVRAEPEWDKLPSTTPGAISLLLHRCLIKDPRQRLQAIGDARIALEEYKKDPSGATLLDGSRAGGTVLLSGAAMSASGLGTWAGMDTRQRRWLGAASAVALVAVVALAYALWQATRPQPKPVGRYVMTAPAELMLVSHPSVAISPDGSMIAMVTVSQGTSRIFLRQRNEYKAIEVPGTENALHPAFSPDSEWLVFMAGGYLKKVPVAGGPIVNIGEMNDGRGGVWLPDGSMIYSPGATFPLMRVAAPGNPPTPFTKLLVEKKERSHRWPTLLPGAKAVLFTVGTLSSPDNYDDADIDAVVVKTGERKTILKGASMALYAPGGYLVFGRAGSLYAVRFDVDKLEVKGNPVPVLTDVGGDSTTGAVHFSIAEDGTLAYLPGGEQGGLGLYRVMWVDQKGATEAIPIPDGVYIDPKLSPDGKKAALVLTKGSNDIWIYDFARKTLNRLTFDGGNITPVWSPDSKYVYYSGRDAATNKRRIFRKAADGGSEAELLATMDSRALLGSVTPDGRMAYFDMPQPTAFTDLLRIPLEKDAKPELLLPEARYDRYSPEISPDGKYLAYISQEGGGIDVYVNALGPGGGKWQVSTNGGVEPRWSRDGKTLFYRHNTQFLAVPVETQPSLSLGTAKILFEGVYNLRTDSGVSYSVSPDGKRFLMVRRASQQLAPESVNVIVNWTEELKRVVK